MDDQGNGIAGAAPTAWSLATAFMGRRAVLKYGAAAFGAALVGGLATACGSGNAATSAGSPTAAVKTGVVNKFLVGNWRVFNWDDEPYKELPQGAEEAGAKSVFDLPRVLSGSTGNDTVHADVLQAQITAKEFTLTAANGEEIRNRAQRIGGTWSFDGSSLFFQLDDASHRAISRAQDVIPASGVPKNVGDLASGSFTWEGDGKHSDSVTYKVSNGMVFLRLPNGSSGNYGICYLAQRI